MKSQQEGSKDSQKKMTPNVNYIVSNASIALQKNTAF